MPTRRGFASRGRPASGDDAGDAESGEESRARKRALRALGQREQGSRELQAKLVAQGFGESQVREVVEGLAEAGFQSDRRYAEMLVRSRIAQGQGPRRISAELASRGVDEPTLRAVMAEADCDWSELAVQLCRRRFRSPARDFAERQKRYRFLAGRGFDAGQIRAALAAGMPDDPDFDGFDPAPD